MKTPINGSGQERVRTKYKETKGKCASYQSRHKKTNNRTLDFEVMALKCLYSGMGAFTSRGVQ
jgi:hypothetical protein